MVNRIDSCDMTDHEAVDSITALLRERARRQTSSRGVFAEDLERGAIYCLILVSGFYYLTKQNRSRLRPNIRSIVIGVGITAIVFVELVILLGIVSMLPNETYGHAGVLFLMFVQLVLFASWVERFKARNHRSELGVGTQCVKCRYDLDGLESALGDAIQIGPSKCPECGSNYPAIS